MVCSPVAFGRVARGPPAEAWPPKIGHRLREGRLIAVDDELRAELISMFDDDQAAVGAVYSTADTYREAFDTSQASTSMTPWPFVLFKWEPAEHAPAVVRHALRVVRRNTARLKSIVLAYGWPGR